MRYYKMVGFAKREMTLESYLSFVLDKSIDR